MDVISSTSNQQIKNVCQLLTKSKARNQQNCFVVEGIRMVSEIDNAHLEKIYCSKTFYQHYAGDSRHNAVLENMDISKLVIVDDNVFKSMSDTVTPQGIMAIVKKSEKKLEEIIDIKSGRYDSEHHCFLVLEDIQDPGNLGTMIRTAEAAGVSGVIMSKGTVDIYNPKVVRSTMGAIFRVNFTYVDDLVLTLNIIKKKGVKLYAAHLKGECYYDEQDYTTPTAFLIGNEGNGLSDKIADMADTYIKIPMCGQVESLNAANAATVLIYESFRQMRRKLE